MKLGEFIEKIQELIQKDWPHLRHCLRSNIEIDDRLREDIIKILRG